MLRAAAKNMPGEQRAILGAMRPTSTAGHAASGAVSGVIPGLAGGLGTRAVAD
jgi:hypothetical protein